MARLKRLCSAVLATVALLGAAVGQSPAPSPSAVHPPPPLPAEVLELRRDLREIIRAPGWNDARFGVLVVSLDRGDTLFALNPDLPLAPASNMKLFSTAAALYYLGPQFRFSTYLLGDGPVRDGVLDGDLILYGTGDPSISGRMLEGPVSTLRKMVDTLRLLGIREIRGDVVGDGSYFDPHWTGPGWLEEDLGAWYGAPVGALSIAENVVGVEVLPGSPGAPARLRTLPETRGLAIENRVRTVTSGATHVRFQRAPDRLVVTGQIRRGHPGVGRSVPVVDPANFAAAVLRAVLADGGIQVRGGVRSVHAAPASRVTFARSDAASAGATPPRVLAAHLSPPLEEIAAVTNHVSHNLFAEALLKTAGRVALGEGSFAAGARAVRYFVECEAGVDSLALRVVDGSGLSRDNRVTARTTIQLLDYMTRSDVWESYLTSLPPAGGSPGLQRMQATAAAGNLRAKTGTIKQVSSLSGYVQAANGERLAFSVIGNGVPSTWRAKRSEDAIGARLARFSRPTPGAAAFAVEPGKAEAVARREPPATREERPDSSLPARVHRVRAGETLDGIARRHGTSVEALQRANPGLRPRRLQVGQKLQIPA